MRHSTTQNPTLPLAAGLGLSLALAIGLQKTLMFMLGPLYSILPFLLLPLALTIIANEMWTPQHTLFPYPGFDTGRRVGNSAQAGRHASQNLMVPTTMARQNQTKPRPKVD